MSIVDHPTYWAKHLNDGKDESVPRRISNSEVSSFQQCERKWYYGYKMNLEPNVTSTSLSRGVLGHEILAVYYKVLMEQPGHYDEAEKAANHFFAPFFGEPGADIAMLTGLKQLLDRYYVLSRGDNWKIRAVEESYDINVNEQFGYVMRLDLLAEIKDELVLVDHKFLYNMPTQEELDMNAQLPKYIGSLRFNGLNVKYGMLNVIRHRQKVGGNPDNETFQRFIIRPSNIEVRNILREQFATSVQILEKYNEDEPTIIRTMNHLTCKNCSFARLCKADLLEQDTTDLLLHNFRANSYGYNADDEVSV